MSDDTTVSDKLVEGTVLGSATVEVIDEIDKVESPSDGPVHPDERVYDRVTILESGWVRCEGPEDHRSPPEGKVPVDHFPPGRVNGVYATDDEAYSPDS